MSKRLIIVSLITAGLVGGLAYFQFVFKPQMIRGFIANAKRPPNSISVATARTEKWVDRENSIGTLIALEGIDVAAQVGGTVQRVFFDSAQSVKKGMPLVELDTDIEKADLASNRATLKEADLAFQRQADLKRKAVTSDANVDAARAKRDSAAAAVVKLQATIAKKTILAPFSGRLGIRKVEVGQYVSPGLALVTLQAIDPVRVDFPMPEQFVARLARGQEIEITVDAYPGTVFKGRIKALDARVAAETRTLMVRGELPNPDKKLLPGMFANVAVVLGKERDVVTVPRTGVTYSLYGDSVWVVKPGPGTDAGGNGGKPASEAGATTKSSGQTGDQSIGKSGPLVVERRFVRTGGARGDTVAISEGLASGERVATSGQLKLTPGAVVNASERNPLTPPAILPKE